MINDHFYTEIYDAKTTNVRERQKSGVMSFCSECKQYSGHEVTCSKVTIESIARLLANSRKSEEAMRVKAARWIEHLQRLTGKLAILRHENNQLRKANEKLRK